MRPDYSTSNHEQGRPHDPWEKFTQRNEIKHVAEDASRLCQPHMTSSDIIENFFLHERRELDDSIPRRRQILRDFLKEVILPCSLGPQPRYESDIARRSSVDHLALLDDRQKHQNCPKAIYQPCNVCKIFSEKLGIPELCDRLKQDVSHTMLPWRQLRKLTCVSVVRSKPKRGSCE